MPWRCTGHGLFEHGAQRAAWLARLGVASEGVDHGERVDAALDDIAAALEWALDIEALLAIAPA
jgi:adenosylcobyric acid synthase